MSLRRPAPAAAARYCATRRGRDRIARIRRLLLQGDPAGAAEAELPGLQTIVQAPLPSLPIERRRPGPGLLAHVAVAKLADGLPLYRQSAIYAREGIDLDRSTLADSVGRMAALLDRLVRAIGRHVRAGPVLHADDTTVEVLAPGQGRARIGRLWAVVRDKRAFGGAAAPAALYRYSPDGGAEDAEALLGSCRGFLRPTAMLASTACLRTTRRVASRASAKSHAGRARDEHL